MNPAGSIAAPTANDTGSPLPPPAGPGAPRPSIHLLPSDLLVLILRHIPLRPLLHVASLVSKQWRAAALRSVTALKIRLQDPAPVFRLFPCLTAVDLGVHVSKQQIEVPISVRQLSVQVGASVELVPLRPCTHLSIGGAEPHDLPLLRESLSTLQHLSVGFIAKPHTFTALASLHFPALTSLSYFAWVRGAAHPFLAAHASQLTTLSCSQGTDAVCDLQDLHFPRLRHLRLGVLPDNFVIDAPALTHVQLPKTALQSATDPRLRAAVTVLKWDHRGSSLPTDEEILLYPKLRTIRLKWLSSQAEFPVVSIAPMLGERLATLDLTELLRLPASILDWPTLAPALTALRKLYLHSKHAPTEPVTLPRLIKLRLHGGNPVEAAARFLPSCTALQFLSLHSTQKCTTESLIPVLSLHAHSALQCVWIDGLLFEAEQRLLSHRHPWLLLHLNVRPQRVVNMDPHLFSPVHPEYA